jgi:hypothetical protein
MMVYPGRVSIVPEAIYLDSCGGDSIRIQHVLTVEGANQGSTLVVDEANADWLSRKLDAIANDPDQPQEFLVSGADALVLSGVGGPRRSVTIQNRRPASASHAGESKLQLSSSYAVRLAKMLRDRNATESHMRRVRRWAERLCEVLSTAKSELSEAIEGAESALPRGICQIILDDRVVGLGGVTVRFTAGQVRRSDVVGVFGIGTETIRLAANHPIRYAYELKPTDTRYWCSVFFEYGLDPSDDGVRGVKLRIDRVRSRPSAN